jgi:hypothetical protein
MFQTRTLLATVLLTAVSVHSARAQSPALANGDVTRLVAMHVSDQTVIAVIHEAAATQFDLSPRAVSELAVSGVSTAVVATMRQSSTPTAPVASTAGPQALAGASAEAALTAHSWPLYSISGSSNQTVVPAPAASTSEGTKSEGTNTTTTMKDEGWWRKRMANLRDQLAMDKAACEPIAGQIRALESTYASYVFHDKDGTAKINTAAASVVETKLVDARTEQGKCVAKVTLDQTAIATVEEEARRLGVLPGWLR